MKDRLTPIAIVVVLLLLGVYVGSYYLLVQIGPGTLWLPRRNPHFPVVYAAEYRAGGKAAEALFYPMNWLDRQARPASWEGQWR